MSTNPQASNSIDATGAIGPSAPACPLPTAPQPFSAMTDVMAHLPSLTRRLAQRNVYTSILSHGGHIGC